MGIVNRRNAVLGWGVWKIGKAVGKRKAKQAVPGTGDQRRLNKGALATIGAATVAALLFRRRKSDDSPDSSS